jgi:hypothetical protein
VPAQAEQAAAPEVQVSKQQLNALLFKSLAYQRKNYCQNCCVISLPILFIGLLAVSQLLLNRVRSTDNKKV